MYPIDKFTRTDDSFFKNYPDYKNGYYDFVTDETGALQIVLGHYVP
jgi:hypothetical protein